MRGVLFSGVNEFNQVEYYNVQICLINITNLKICLNLTCLVVKSDVKSNKDILYAIHTV